MLHFSLSFNGLDADDHLLDYYDAAQAMLGFQRSLALTTHLVINGEVITQAPALKGARIMAPPPQPGSWKTVATVAIGLGGAIYGLGTAPKDTPLGHLVHSAYDYVISESLGFRVDYDSTLGEQYERLKEEEESTLPALRQPQLDSVIEKVETAVGDMHRPIVRSQTATRATLSYIAANQEKSFEHELNKSTHDYIAHTEISDDTVVFDGYVSSYNINTFKGRIYVLEHQRPIPFNLAEVAKTPRSAALISTSLSKNAVERLDPEAGVTFEAFERRSKSGILKSYDVINVKP